MDTNGEVVGATGAEVGACVWRHAVLGGEEAHLWLLYQRQGLARGLLNVCGADIYPGWLNPCTYEGRFEILYRVCGVKKVL